ncbi:MAG: M28 family peptidase [Nitrospirae bacterium]|nr:M28 family peptidase [Nitrospirota bacterium]
MEFAFKYGSDHYSFYEKGIPAIDLTSSYHEDFHRITDTWEKVSMEKVSKIAELVYQIVNRVAGSQIYFEKPLSVEVPFPGKQ